MTSSVLDATLCLLLVSAAVVTVVTSTPETPAGDGRADAVAETLATTTATVNYSLTSANASESGDSGSIDASLDRATHGTLAGLLARAAVANVTVDGERTTRAHDGFRRRIVRRVQRVVRANRTSVHAVWRPVRGVGIRGEVLVGGRPPPNVAVHAAVLTVPSSYPTARDAALDAAERDGMSGVANVTADRTVTGMFPPERTRFALQETSTAAETARRRYRRVEALVGEPPTRDLRSGKMYAANERLTAALADRLERGLRASFADPVAAARSVRVGSVRIVVRTWS
ncbi:hypothetical protein ACFQJD_03750 [Haloplanus sp. GCM10025708]|uniref:DUF7284 family protein n=1 Tax=Haloferacaceae TaxID=1644056 RepID=UPI0036190BE6